MANSIFQFLSNFFASYGYWAVFLGVMAENVGLPIPGETVLLFAGFLAYRGQIHIIPAILTAIAGGTVGAALGFLIGRYAGASVINRFLNRFPTIAERYQEAQKTFLKHGQWAVFGARFITGVRVFAGILAGAMEMKFPTFVLYSFAGAICWSFVIGYVGFLFGGSWGTLVGFVGKMNRIVLIIVGIVVVIYFLRNLVRRRRLT